MNQPRRIGLPTNKVPSRTDQSSQRFSLMEMAKDTSLKAFGGSKCKSLASGSDILIAVTQCFGTLCSR